MKVVQDFGSHTTADRKAFIFAKNNEVWTWERLTSEVNHLAHGLIGLGIQPGDRVALHMANLPELVVSYVACFQVGAIAVPLNIRLKKAELEPLLRRLRPSLYIGQAALYSQIAGVEASILAANRRFLVDGPANDRRVQPWFNLLGGTNGTPVRRTIDPHAPAVLLTTSGTTGQLKFVTHTLATLRKMTQSFAHWDLDIDQTAAVALPMVHASGCFTVLACLLLRGEFDVALLRFSLQHMSPDIRTRILSALHSRKAPTRVIAIEGDDHSFVFRLRSDAVQALLEAKGRKQAAQGGDRHIGSRLPELFSRLGFGLIRQDCIPIDSKTIGWDTWWSLLGPVLLSGADNANSALVDQATTWFKENRGESARANGRFSFCGIRLECGGALRLRTIAVQTAITVIRTRIIAFPNFESFVDPSHYVAGPPTNRLFANRAPNSVIANGGPWYRRPRRSRW